MRVCYTGSMQIEIKSELAKVIDARVVSGRNATPEDVLHEALALLAAQDDAWTSQHTEIEEKIHQAMEEVVRGECYTQEQVLAHRQIKRAEFLATHG